MLLKNNDEEAIHHKAVVPTRPFGPKGADRLPEVVPIIGLGCSSFSSFFSDDDGDNVDTSPANNKKTLDKMDPQVQDWIQTIRYAIECGISLLDTAPWYGHGSSEIVIGWAMEDMLAKDDDNASSSVAATFDRNNIYINTKIGRYEQDPKKQFDFSYDATIASCKRSLERMKCDYINVLQLHDPEFAPSLDLLMNETVPAMMECRKLGYCKALGMTGYPLKTQYQIMARSLELQSKGDSCSRAGAIWDQALTYGHYNLFDTSIFDQPIKQYPSFSDFCNSTNIGLMAAAPLAMGLLTNNTLPDWHPAPAALTTACKAAAAICDEEGVNISTLAIIFALANPRIPCTLIGMKSVAEVKVAVECACRFQSKSNYDGGDNGKMQEPPSMQTVLTDSEYKAFVRLRDPKHGPFASIWMSGECGWDGIAEARQFWEQMEGETPVDWHMK